MTREGLFNWNTVTSIEVIINLVFILVSQNMSTIVFNSQFYSQDNNL